MEVLEDSKERYCISMGQCIKRDGRLFWLVGLLAVGVYFFWLSEIISSAKGRWDDMMVGLCCSLFSLIFFLVLLAILFFYRSERSIAADKKTKRIMITTRELFGAKEIHKRELELQDIKEIELRVNSFAGDETPSLWLVFKLRSNGELIEKQAFFNDYTDWEMNKRVVKHLAGIVGAKAYFTVLRGAPLLVGIDNDPSTEREEIK